LRVKRKGELEYFVGRRYGDFARLHKQLRTELPGKVLPPMPKKNKTNTTATGLLGRITGDDNESDVSSVSSKSTVPPGENAGFRESMKNLTVRDHHRQKLSTSSRGASPRASPRPSVDGARGSVPNSPIPNSPRTDVSAGYYRANSNR
jgi:hypothetical protein